MSSTAVQPGESDNLPASPVSSWRSSLNAYAVEIQQLLTGGFGPRLAWTKVAVALGFLAGILCSRHLWISSRYYPLIPISRRLPHINYPLDYILFLAAVFLLVSIAFSLRPRVYIGIFSVLIVVLALLDQSRWQPWAYQYLVMLIAIGLFSWRRDDLQGGNDCLNICRLVLVCIYFYSGLQKLNHGFAELILPRLMSVFGEHLHVVRVFAIAAALTELCIGLALLSRKYRNLAVVAAVMMHLFILLAIGPAGLRWNWVVWPWNVAMITLLFVLFWKADVPAGAILWKNKFVFQKVVLALFAIMPALSFFGLWDSYLSASLYSGNVTISDMVVSDEVKQQLPAGIWRFTKKLQRRDNELSINDWSLGELNVPPYPEKRIYIRIAQQICKTTNNSPDVVLLIQEKTTLLGGGQISRYTCFGSLAVQNR